MDSGDRNKDGGTDPCRLGADEQQHGDQDAQAGDIQSRRFLMEFPLIRHLKGERRKDQPAERDGVVHQADEPELEFRQQNGIFDANPDGCHQIGNTGSGRNRHGGRNETEDEQVANALSAGCDVDAGEKISRHERHGNRAPDAE
ncbi:MAG: hypothetical protein VW475_08610 [Curvibacter sp.]